MKPSNGQKQLTRTIVLAATISCMILLLVRSWYYSECYGGTDLRNRTVASRLLATPHSPYYYKWSPSDGDYFLDPNDRADRRVNGTSVTPAVLYIVYPLSVLPYKAVRRIWTLLLFLLAGGTILLLTRGNRKTWAYYPAVIILLGIFCSKAWIFNIERGQIYMLYGFLMALSYTSFEQQGRWGKYGSGFISGILILLRPPVLVMGLAFFWHSGRKWLAGNILGFLTGCLIFIMPKPSLWMEYFRAMNDFANHSELNHAVTHKEIDFEKTGRIEGMDNLSTYMSFGPAGLFPVDTYAQLVGKTIPYRYFLGMFAVLSGLLLTIYYRPVNRPAGGDSMFLFGFLLYILSELFIVAPRPGYSLIQWVFPFSIVALRFQRDQVVLSLLVVSLLLYHGFPLENLVPYQPHIAELSFILVLTYVVFYKMKAVQVRQESNRWPAKLPEEREMA